ncbi:hypothetical protein EU538_10905 [Candidatus Thorarchaeota archaeon]|nr:MAG: hypothetical protein EU538_10905 [Candidatus Thorarchaeota archaeon]
MSPDRRSSPWAYDECELICPKCGSGRVFRVVNRWALRKGYQIFKCASCGRTFYDKEVDDYSPTFGSGN